MQWILHLNVPLGFTAQILIYCSCIPQMLQLPCALLTGCVWNELDPKHRRQICNFLWIGRMNVERCMPPMHHSRCYWRTGCCCCYSHPLLLTPPTLMFGLVSLRANNFSETFPKTFQKFSETFGNLRWLLERWKFPNTSCACFVL